MNNFQKLLSNHTYISCFQLLKIIIILDIKKYKKYVIIYLCYISLSKMLEYSYYYLY